MIDNIIKFIDILRSMNIRISIAESIDAIKTIDIISIEDREDFKNSLRSVLIKNYDDIEKFDKLFDIYFIYKEQTKQIEINEDDFEKMFAQLQNEFNDNYNDIGQEQPLNQDLQPSPKQDLKDNFQDKVDMFSTGGDDILKQEAQQIADNMSYNKQTIDQDIEKELIKKGYELSKTQCMNKQNEDFINEKYDKLKQFIKEEIEKNEVRKNGEEAIKEIMKEEYDDLLDKDFIEFNKDDIELIKKMLSKIIKKLNNIYTRKKIKSHKGSIDIKTTIKKSIKNGIVKDIYYKKRKKDKNKLVVLCDISGSMYNYVKFILQIVIGIEQVFEDVRVYVFMEKIKEITEDMKNSDDIIRTVEHIYRSTHLGYGTDYGNSLFWFSRKPLDKKTRVIIIGDGENGGDEIGDDYLFEVKQKSKCIYWLNPVKEEKWDKNFNNYKVYCTNVFECSNLRQLENIMRKII